IQELLQHAELAVGTNLKHANGVIACESARDRIDKLPIAADTGMDRARQAVYAVFFVAQDLAHAQSARNEVAVENHERAGPMAADVERFAIRIRGDSSRAVKTAVLSLENLDELQLLPAVDLKGEHRSLAIVDCVNEPVVGREDRTDRPFQVLQLAIWLVAA